MGSYSLSLAAKRYIPNEEDSIEEPMRQVTQDDLIDWINRTFKSRQSNLVVDDVVIDSAETDWVYGHVVLSIPASPTIGRIAQWIYESLVLTPTSYFFLVAHEEV